MFYPLARINGDKNRKGCVCKNLETFKELIGVYLRRIDLKLRTKETRNRIEKLGFEDRSLSYKKKKKEREKIKKREGKTWYFPELCLQFHDFNLLPFLRDIL